MLQHKHLHIVIMQIFFCRIQNGHVHQWSVIVHKIQPRHVAAIAIKVSMVSLIVLCIIDNKEVVCMVGAIWFTVFI